MTSSQGKPSTLDLIEDRLLTFNCYQFRRGVRAARSRSRRWVSAEQCLCATENPSPLYDLYFTESSDKEEAKELKEINEKYADVPPDRIGVFNPDGKPSTIYVPPHFMEVLWAAAIAADSVVRTIQLSVQPQKDGGLAIFDASLSERIREPHFWMEKLTQPAGLRALLAQLRSLGLWGVEQSLLPVC